MSSTSRGARAVDLASTLDRLGFDAFSVDPLPSSLRPNGAPRAFLVITREGSRLKVRVARTERLAARAVALGRALADSRVPVALARDGRVTVEPWIEGVPLSEGRPRAADLSAAADLLAAIHAFPGAAGEHLPRRQRTTAILRRAHSHLAELEAAKVVAVGEGRVLGSHLRCLPAIAVWGLSHGDYCAENLVIARNGSLASVDNELLRRGFLEYDLARSWYRWPMAQGSREGFERHYRRALGAAMPPGAERSAWRTAATLKGVHLRSRRGLPLAHGIGLLQALSREVTPGRGYGR